MHGTHGRCRACVGSVQKPTDLEALFRQSVFRCQLAATFRTCLGLVLTFVPTVQADKYLITLMWGGLIFVAGHTLLEVLELIKHAGRHALLFVCSASQLR